MLAWILSLLLVINSVNSNSSNQVQLAVLPTQGYEPLTVYGVIILEPSYLDTWLCLLWDSDYGNSGSSCWQQDQYSTKTRRVTLKNLPAGSYSVVARLWRDQKIIQSDVRTVIVERK